MENSVAVRAAAAKAYWRADDARVVVEAWRQSGESMAAFSRRLGVDRQRVARWSAELGSARPAEGFHPVRVVGVAGATSAIEIDLPDGRRVRVPAGFAEEDLRRVLGVLEETGRC